MAITKQQSVWRSTATRGEAEAPFSPGRHASVDAAYDGQFVEAPKWAAWKVTVVVVVFCAAFWSGIGYIAMRLLG